MAKMGFREPNQVRWQGIRPGHRGTQVILDIDVENDTQVLIDGTQTTITYLTAFSIGQTRNLGGHMWLFVTDNADNHKYTLVYSGAQVDLEWTWCGMSFPFPIEIPAGYKVKCLSTAAGIIVKGFLHGWEE